MLHCRYPRTHATHSACCPRLVSRDAGLLELKVATSYKLHGKRLPATRMPASLEDLGAVEVEYLTLPGWMEDISKCTSFAQLPANAQKYLKVVQEAVGVPISWVGVGPDREDMIAISI
jgi:adenylosuccinate synthase